MTQAKFSADKLLENAVTSIRLGVEDFERSRAADGDEGRALSAARNLFAGILLLFKYRIVDKARDDAEGAKLIFKAPQVHPTLLSDGTVDYQAKKAATNTIEFHEIEERFKTLGINTDWTAVRKLRDERNDIEHLYPSSSGAVSKFVADSYPVLKAFAIDELQSEPADLLGEAWQVMLKHQAFFEQELSICEMAWDDSGLPGGMDTVAKSAICEACGSSLVRPLTQEKAGDWEAGKQRYVCVGCGNQGSLLELLYETLIELEGGHDIYALDGEPTAECPDCGHHTYTFEHGECAWCGYTRRYVECVVCGNDLSLDEQGLRGLCSYHHNIASKAD